MNIKILKHLLYSFILFNLFVYCYAGGFTDEQIVKAIFKTEGGFNTRFPYGIKSVKCSGIKECRQVCMNTVRNNRKRFAKQTEYTDFIEFLGDRYCPKSVDPIGNVNWKKNVMFFLKQNLLQSLQ